MLVFMSGTCSCRPELAGVEEDRRQGMGGDRRGAAARLASKKQRARNERLVKTNGGNGNEGSGKGMQE